MLDTATADDYPHGATRLQGEPYGGESGSYRGSEPQPWRYDASEGAEGAKGLAGEAPAEPSAEAATAVSLLHQAAVASGVVIPPRPARKPAAAPVIDYRF